MGMLLWRRNISVTVTSGWWHALVAVRVIILRRHGARRLVRSGTSGFGAVVSARAMAVRRVVALFRLPLARGWVLDDDAAG